MSWAAALREGAGLAVGPRGEENGPRVGLGQGKKREGGPGNRGRSGSRERRLGLGRVGCWVGFHLFYFYFFSLFLFQTTPKLI